MLVGSSVGADEASAWFPSNHSNPSPTQPVDMSFPSSVWVEVPCYLWHRLSEVILAVTYMH